MRNIGIVLAKGSSRRIPKKNLQKICDKEMFLYPVDILRASGVCDKIVVSTDDDEVREVATNYGVHVVMRDPSWDKDEWQFNAPTHGTIEKYENRTGQRFDDCTLILGNSVFVRASWIRVALDFLRNRLVAGMKLTHVYPVDCVDSICTVFRIHRAGLYFAHRLPLPHVGINLDIDYPSDLELARKIMTTIDYPLNETIHEEADRLENMISKSDTPRFQR